MASPRYYDGTDPNQVAARRVRLIVETFPEMITDIDKLAQFAKSPYVKSDEALLDGVGEMLASRGFGNTRITLDGMSDNAQRDAWKQMSPIQRSWLEKSGYKPPAKRNKLQSILHDPIPGSGVRKLIGVATAPIVAPARVTARAVGAAVSPPLNAMTWAGQKTIDVFDSALQAASAADASGSQGPASRAMALTHSKEAVEAARERGMMTERDAQRFLADETARLDWYEDYKDPDVPREFQLYRGTGLFGFREAFGTARHQTATNANFRPSAWLEARELVGSEPLVQLAMRAAATGETNKAKMLVELLEDDGVTPNTPEYYKRAEELTDLLARPSVAQAVKVFNGARSSLGDTVMTGALGNGARGSKPFTIGKGAIDVAVLFTADPVFVTAATTKAARIAQHGGDLVENLSTLRRFANGTLDLSDLGPARKVFVHNRLTTQMRAAEEIATAFSKVSDDSTEGLGAIDDLRRRYPWMARGLPYLADWHRGAVELGDAGRHGRPIRKAVDVIEALEHPAGLQQVQAGRFTRAWDPAPVALPWLRAEGKARTAFTSALRRVDDWGTDARHTAPKVPKDPARAQSPIGQAARNVVAAPFVAAKLFGKAPRLNFLNTNDPDAVAALFRLGTLSGMPVSDSRNRMGAWLFADEGARDAIIADFITNLWTQVGVDVSKLTDEGLGQWLNDVTPRQIVGKRIGDVVRRMGNQRYATQGFDVGQNGRRMALSELDLSHAMANPTYREVAMTANTGMFMAGTYRALNPEVVETLMAGWRATNITRMAFGPRNAGEEVLAFIARNGLPRYLQLQAARVHTNAEIAKELRVMQRAAEEAGDLAQAAVYRKRAQRLADGLVFRPTQLLIEGTLIGASHVPLVRRAVTRPRADTMIDWSAKLWAHITGLAMRTPAGWVARKEDIAGMRLALAHQHGLHSALAAPLSAVSAVSGRLDTVDRFSELPFDLPLNEDVVRGVSQFREVETSGKAGAWMWAQNADRVMSSRLYQAAARAWVKIVTPGAASTLRAGAKARAPHLFDANPAVIVDNVRSEIRAHATRFDDLMARLDDEVEGWAKAGGDVNNIGPKAPLAVKLWDQRRKAGADKMSLGELLSHISDDGVTPAMRAAIAKADAKARTGDLNAASDVLEKMRGRPSTIAEQIAKQVDLLADFYAQTAALFPDVASDVKGPLASLLATIDEIGPRGRAMVASDVRFRQGTTWSARQMAHQDIRNVLAGPEMTEFVSRLQRVAGAANPPKSGQVGAYWPTFDEGTAALARTQAETALDVLAALRSGKTVDQIVAEAVDEAGLAAALVAERVAELSPSRRNRLERWLSLLDADGIITPTEAGDITLSRAVFSTKNDADEVVKDLAKVLEIDILEDGVDLLIDEAAEAAARYRVSLVDIDSPGGRIETQPWAQGMKFTYPLVAEGEARVLGTSAGSRMMIVPDGILSNAQPIYRPVSWSVNGQVRHGTSRDQVLDELASDILGYFEDQFMTRAVLTKRNPAGVRVPVHTAEDAADDIDTALDAVASGFRLAPGQADRDLLYEAVLPALNNQPIMHRIGQIAPNDLPLLTVSAVDVPRPDTPSILRAMQKVQGKVFRAVIDPVMDAISRTPIFVDAYVRIDEAGRPVLRTLIAADRTYQEATGIAERYGYSIDEVWDAWLSIEGRSMKTKTSKLAEALAFLDEGRLPGTERTVPSGARPDLPAGTGEILDTDKARALLTQSDLAKLRNGLAMRSHFEQAYSNATMENAVQSVIPFVDDHHTRSFISDAGRQLAPFSYAEESFLRRWARTTAHSPEALYRMQMYATALRTIGFTEKDADGNDVFTYPAFPAVIQAISSVPVLSHILFGGPITVPVLSNVTGRVDRVVPGVGDPARVSLSPLIQIPAAGARRFLGWDISDEVAGTQGQSRRPWWQWVLPGFVSTLVQSRNPDSAEMNRVVVGAMQMNLAEANRLRIDAEELTARAKTEPDAADRLLARAAKARERADELAPPPTASPTELSHWKTEMTRAAALLMVQRALLQFTAPTAGTINAEGIQMTNDWYDVLSRSGNIEEANGRWLAEHPDGLPFTVSRSESVSGAPGQFSEAAAKWLDKHETLAKNNLYAAPWLIPPDAGEYDPAAYYTQVAWGWRHRKDAQEWAEDYYFAAAAPRYYATRDARDAALERVKGDGDATEAINTAWRKFADQYMDHNPVFAFRHGSREAAQRRGEVRREILALDAEGSLPDEEHAQAVARLVRSFDQWRTVRMQVPQGEERQRFDREGWLTYAKALVGKHPSIEGFYRSVIVPDDGLDDNL